MSVNVIDTIKPKNGGSFPVVEAVDVAVSGGTRLNTVLEGKANTSDITAINAQLASKASQSDLSEIRAAMTYKAAQSSLDATNVVVASKAAQSSLDALTVIVERKADKKDYDSIFEAIDTKADATTVSELQASMQQADTSLQNQINQIEISASAESVVAPEVAAARVGADGTSYSTLKERLDTENEQLNTAIDTILSADVTVEADWSNKSVEPDGSQSSTDMKRMSNDTLINIPAGCKANITLAAGYFSLVYEFDSTQTFIQKEDIKEVDGDTSPYFRLLVGSQEDIDITDADEIVTITISSKMRSDISKLQEDVAELESKEENTEKIVNGIIGTMVTPNWSNRSVNPNGSQGTLDANRMSNNNLVYIPTGCKAVITIETGYFSLIYKFDNTQTFIAQENTFEVDGDLAPYIRIAVGASNSIDITQANSICKIEIKSKFAHNTLPSAYFADIVNSANLKKVVLLGDSITQGAGSTDFVIFTKIIDGVEYSIRGNGPGYPDAGSDYQVGDYIYGDSGRKWYEALDGHGWSQSIKAYFEDKFNCTVKNYGCTGANSGDLYAAIKNKVIGEGFDLAVVTIGTNNRQDSSLATYYADMIRIINALRYDGTKVIVVGNIPASVTNENLYTHHMEDINHLSMKAAKVCDVPFISLYSDFMDYCEYTNTTIDSYLGDGLHPNDTGYAVMFNLLCKEFGLVPKRPNATW